MKRKALVLAMVLLAASTVMPGVSRANIAPVGGIDTIELVLLLFSITLVVEGVLILLAMGTRVSSFVRLCLAILGANALSYAFIVAYFAVPLTIPGVTIDWFLVVGEILVVVFEAAFYTAVLKGRVTRGLWPLSSRPLLSLIATVVFANLVTTLLGVVLLAQ